MECQLLLEHLAGFLPGKEEEDLPPFNATESESPSIGFDERISAGRPRFSSSSYLSLQISLSLCHRSSCDGHSTTNSPGGVISCFRQARLERTSDASHPSSQVMAGRSVQPLCWKRQSFRHQLHERTNLAQARSSNRALSTPAIPPTRPDAARPQITLPPSRNSIVHSIKSSIDQELQEDRPFSTYGQDHRLKV